MTETQQTWHEPKKRGGGSIAYPRLHGVQGRSESSEWQDKWQQAVKELADVKERAWSLLEEKDLQLQSLKVTSLPLPHVGHEALFAGLSPACTHSLGSSDAMSSMRPLSLHADLGILPSISRNHSGKCGAR